MTIGSESLPPISTKDGTDEDLPLKSKLILSADFSELHKDSCKFVQSVKVCLTATELVVLKRSSEKTVKFSQVRKHPLKTVHLSRHEVVPNAVVVEVPCTVLRYVYQLENGSDLKEWLAEVIKCRQGGRPESKVKSCEIPRLHRVNGLLSVYGEEAQKSYSSPSSPTPRFVDCSSTSNGDELNSVVSSRSTTPEIRSLSQNDAAGCCIDGALVEDSNRHSIAPAMTLPFASHSTVVQTQRNRLLPKMTRARSARSFRHHSVRAKNHEHQKGKQKLRASVSDFPSLEKDDSTLEKLQEFVLSVSPPSSPPPSGDFLHSRFRHIQIRKGCKKYSPRIRKGKSDSLPTPNLPQKYAEPKTNGSHSSTLPRRNFSTRDMQGEDMVRTAPSSPVPKPAKSPKLLKNLKIFHRRWQSSGGNIKAHIIEALREPSSNLGSPVAAADDSVWPCPLHALPPRALAEELTLMDAEMLRRIAPHELEDGAWMDNKAKHELAPNVMAMVKAFNRVALLVPTEILQETTPQARAKVISIFIQVASKCYQLHNYNSLKAVLAGLQCTPIYRLKKTWKEVPSKRRKRFTQLCRLMSEEDNWQLYRKELGRRLAADTPCVPFLGLFLTQVVQQESYHKMRVEKDCSSKSNRRRSSSFGNCIINNCALEAEKSEWRGSTLSSSAPTSPVMSDEEEDCDGPVGGGSRSMTHRGNDVAFLEVSQNSLFKQSSLATSESSLDSKCSLEDYLKHRKVVTNPHSMSCDAHSLPFKAPNGVFRPVPDLKLNPKTDENSLSQTSDCVDLVGTPNLSAIVACNEGSENDCNSDSGFPSTSTSRKASVCASLTKSLSVSQDSLPQLDGCPSELEISTSDVNLSLKKSRSLELLCNSYEEDGLKDFLHSTFAEMSRFSASLQSIDSVFSNEDDDEAPSPPFLGDFELSECNSDISLQLQSSFDSGTSLPPLALSRTRRALYAEIQDNGRSEPLKSLSDVNITISETEELSAVHPRWVRRSQSYCVDSPTPKRNLLWRKKRSDPAIVIQNAHTDEHREEIVTPYEQLHRYQMVSLGCCSGAEARPQLRTLLSNSTYNSESVNYKLSCEREPCNH